MINLLEDIGNIVQKNKYYRYRIEVDEISVTVYMICDYERTFSEKLVIPITYDIVEECAYINHEKLLTMYHEKDYGICLDEIKIIKNLMEYFENHNSEIEKICSMFKALDISDMPN